MTKKRKRKVYYMREELSTYDNLKGYFDKVVNTNVTLDTLGIDMEEFMDEARDSILQRVNDLAAERMEINKE